MTEAFPFIDAAMKYLVVPAIVWVWMLYKTQAVMATEIAVLRAEAAAERTARKEDREATHTQLSQIHALVQSINTRIDTLAQRPREA